MIRVNGVPLDNPDLGWIFRPRSVPYSSFEADLGQLAAAGRDGTIGTPTTVHAPLYPLQVNTPPSGWASLLALFGGKNLVLTRDDQPGWEIPVRFASSAVDKIYSRNQWIDATFIVELTGAFWRAKIEATSSSPMSTASIVQSVFAGLSAPVADAMVRVKGAATGIQITDASGAWVTLPNVTASQYVRFESNTGKAFITTTDVWVGGTDVSGEVDFGGPRGVFEITPVLASLDPSIRDGKLAVTTVTRTGAVVAVRGKAAYAF